MSALISSPRSTSQMTRNRLTDFTPDQFTIRLFCDACVHQVDLDRGTVPEDLTIPELTNRLRCTEFGGRACSIRIICRHCGRI
jgi:hypothetical protein